MVRAEIEGHRALLESDDGDIRELAKEELPALREGAEKLEAELRILLLPKDPNDERNVVLEIRAGTGGEEASLFAADLFRMYSRYAETRGVEGGGAEQPAPPAWAASRRSSP